MSQYFSFLRNGNLNNKESATIFNFLVRSHSLLVSFPNLKKFNFLNLHRGCQRQKLTVGSIPQDVMLAHCGTVFILHNNMFLQTAF